MRGRRLPAADAERIEYTGLRLPLSRLALDLFGQPVASAIASGDPDGQARVTERGAVPLPWLAQPTALMPMWMFTDEGQGAPCDPRHALAGVLKRWKAQGWKPQVCASLDVYLTDDTGPSLTPALIPAQGRRPARQPGGLTQLDEYAAFFDALHGGAEAMGIGLAAVEAGAGPAQFRLILSPQPAMKSADDLWLLKALLRGTARAHDMAACFLARPFDTAPGSALHLGFHAQDRDRRNLFDNGLVTGSDLMHRAVAGGVSGMPGAMLVFAPHAPSFTRYGPDSLAPTGAAWGYENRSCALRIPGGPSETRHIEQRAPGADANPYLALAAILGSAIAGIEDDLSAPDPVIGSAYEQRVLQCPMDWDSAIERFEASPRMARIFPAPLIAAMVALKRQEQARLAHLSPNETSTALMDAH